MPAFLFMLREGWLGGGGGDEHHDWAPQKGIALQRSKSFPGNQKIQERNQNKKNYSAVQILCLYLFFSVIT